MLKKSEWLLQHGWGFDHTCWDTWRTHIPSQVSLLTPDRGYFKQNAVNSNSSYSTAISKYNVIITHSFGLHLIPETLFSNAHLLVILSGFKSFTSSSQQNLFSKMHSNLTHFHQKVLEKFYHNCGIPHYRNNLNPDIPLLQNDLLELQKSTFKETLIEKIPHILFIHGDADQIVPIQRSLDFQQLLPQSKIEILNGANHALPFTHAKVCCDLIMQAVSK